MITVEQLERILMQLKAMPTPTVIELYRCEGAIEAIEGLKVALQRQISAGDKAGLLSDKVGNCHLLPCNTMECGADFGRYFGITR